MEPDSPVRHKGRVLIVDDDPSERQKYASLLAGDTYDLQFARDGEEGLAMASADPPDLILLDVMMPGMDGYEVCARLRGDRSLAEVPVLMLTGLDDPSNRLRGIQVGADSFVSKSYDPLELKTRVQTIIRLNRYRRLLEERKRSEAALLERESLYRSLFYENTASMLLLDPVSLEITDANAAACLFYGWSRDIVTGKSLEAIEVGPREHFAQSLGRGIWPVYQEHRRAGGDVRQVEIYAGTLHTGAQERIYCIVHDITERRIIEEQLKISHEELRALALRLQSVREGERTRLARAVHDELGQLLTCLKMDFAWLTGQLDANDGCTARRTERIAEVIDTAILTVQTIASELRPGILDNLGLVPALEWQSEEFAERASIPCAFSTSSDDIPMDRERATAIFRVFQETLTNISRHARATRVSVRVRAYANELVLRVRDNGVGMEPQKVFEAGSLGLLGMRERLHPFDGSLEFGGRPGIGTVVFVRIPLRSPEG